ncbi:MAG: hypothetical protein GY710_03430 [Desulfobacteraceae bacterium]|nr:hypothetical protein [Desulfobacteraceae bacterium]
MSSRFLDIDVDTGDLQQLALDLSATPKEVDRALRSTANRMAGWLKTKSAAGISKKLDIPQKVLRKRIHTLKSSRGKGSNEKKIWFGLNPISLMSLNPKKTASGIKARGITVNGGFISMGKNRRLNVFKRRGKKRLPIDKQSVGIYKESIQFIDNRLLASREFKSVFFKTFERNLKWWTSAGK